MHFLFTIISCAQLPHRWININPVPDVYTSKKCHCHNNLQQLIDMEDRFTSFAIFSYKIITYLNKRQPVNLQDTCKILYYTYNYLPKLTDQLKFLSLAAFNSSNFSVLKVNDDKFGARGVLHIEGESEYKLLAELTRDNVWIIEPERLERVDLRAVSTSIVWWLRKREFNKVLYEEMKELFE